MWKWSRVYMLCTEVSASVCMMSSPEISRCGYPAPAARWIDAIATSASHSRCDDLFFREIRHAVFGDEVVAVD
jgi:hypothetical protein